MRSRWLDAYSLQPRRIPAWSRLASAASSTKSPCLTLSPQAFHSFSAPSTEAASSASALGDTNEIGGCADWPTIGTLQATDCRCSSPSTLLVNNDSGVVGLPELFCGGRHSPAPRFPTTRAAPAESTRPRFRPTLRTFAAELSRPGKPGLSNYAAKSSSVVERLFILYRSICIRWLPVTRLFSSSRRIACSLDSIAFRFLL